MVEGRWRNGSKKVSSKDEEEKERQIEKVDEEERKEETKQVRGKRNEAAAGWTFILVCYYVSFMSWKLDVILFLFGFQYSR